MVSLMPAWMKRHRCVEPGAIRITGKGLPLMVVNRPAPTPENPLAGLSAASALTSSI